MIIELYFGIVGGVNLSLEKSWKLIEHLLRKYPHASWKRIIDEKKNIGKYIIKIF